MNQKYNFDVPQLWYSETQNCLQIIYPNGKAEVMYLSEYFDQFPSWNRSLWDGESHIIQYSDSFEFVGYIE